MPLKSALCTTECHSSGVEMETAQLDKVATQILIHHDSSSTAVKDHTQRPPCHTRLHIPPCQTHHSVPNTTAYLQSQLPRQNFLDTWLAELALAMPHTGARAFADSLCASTLQWTVDGINDFRLSHLASATLHERCGFALAWIPQQLNAYAAINAYLHEQIRQFKN